MGAMLRRALVLALVVVIAVAMWLRSAPEVAPALEPASAPADAPRVALSPDLVGDDARNPAAVVAEVDAEPTRPHDAPLPPAKFDRGCEVTVALRSEPGLAIEKGTSLSCTDERGNSYDEDRVDPSTFTIRRVPLGPHRLAAFAPGHARGFATFEVRAGELEKRVEVPLRALENGRAPRNVLVRWQTEDGRPFVPAIAAAWTGPERAWIRVRNSIGGESRTPIPHASRADLTAEGVARIRPGAPPDSCAVLDVGDAPVATVDGYVDSRRLASATLPPGVDEVVLRASVEECLAALGGVRGCVVAAPGGARPKDLSVSVERADGLTRKRPTMTATDCFLHENLAPGPALLRVTDADRELTRAITIESGRVLDLGDLTLTAGCALRLRFVGAEGQQLQDARFECFASGDAAKEVPVHKLRRAKSPVTPVAKPAEPDLVIVQADGFGLAVHPIRPCGERGDEVEIRLERAVVVVLDLGLGDATPALWLETAEGLGLGQHPTLPTGLVRVELAPGEYRARRSVTDEGTEFRVGREPTVVALR